MPDLDSLNRLTEAYDSQVHAIRQQITAFGQAYWDSLPHYRTSAVEDMIEAITPRVAAGQLRIADLTRAYLAQCARELGWKVVLPPIDRRGSRCGATRRRGSSIGVCSRGERTAPSAWSRRRSAITVVTCCQFTRDVTVGCSLFLRAWRSIK